MPTIRRSDLLQVVRWPFRAVQMALLIATSGRWNGDTAVTAAIEAVGGPQVTLAMGIVYGWREWRSRGGEEATHTTVN